jgi:hypothetical protein
MPFVQCQRPLGGESYLVESSQPSAGQKWSKLEPLNSTSVILHNTFPLFASLGRKTACMPLLALCDVQQNFALPIHRKAASLKVMPAQAFGQHCDMQQNFANLISLYSIFTFDSIEYFEKFLPFCNSIQALPPILSQPPQTASSLSTISIQPHLERVSNLVHKWLV